MRPRQDHTARGDLAGEGELPVSNAVSLERAGPDAGPLLSNLLELYIHDMSEVFPVKLGPDGRFG
jgi:hypothetical protein